MKYCTAGNWRRWDGLLIALSPLLAASILVTISGCGDSSTSPDTTVQRFEPADPEPATVDPATTQDPATTPRQPPATAPAAAAGVQDATPPPSVAAPQVAESAAPATPSTDPAATDPIGSQPTAQRPAPPQPNTDEASVEQAEAVLKAAGAFYAKAQSIQVDTELALQQEVGGNAQKMAQERKFALEKPNKWVITTEGGPSSIDMISDGKTLVQFNRQQNSYLEMDAPETLGALLGASSQGPAASQLLSQAGMFFGKLIGEDPYQALREHATQVGYLGQEEIAGKKAHRVVISSPIFRSDLWISAGPEPLILKVDSDLSLAIKTLIPPGANQGDVRMTVSESFHNWRVNQELPAETFAFNPPPGAQKIDPGAPGGGPPDAGPKVGQEAPEIQGADLDGAPFKLSDYRGKVVMLTFWGDW
ncbi:MAG: DUF2092 domain-containing protein [Planctomycetota bacterium]|nr:DUF2092 domain-containing protein [Planctomycetota bacterium]